MGRKPKVKPDPDQYLPGLAPKRNKKIHDKAVAFGEARSEYNRAKDVRDAAKQALIDTVRSELGKDGQTQDVITYAYDNVEVTVEATDKVKMKIKDRSEIEEG